MPKKKAPVARASDARTANPALAAWPFPRTPLTRPLRAAIRAAADPIEGDAPAAQSGEGERIRAEALSLYTDASKNQVERIAIEQLSESPSNARTHYDEQELNALAETIRGVGVMQAILVRPIAYGSGVALKLNDKEVQAYEIVFGHRRFRASKIAGETHIPAIVRELTHAQATQLQTIENVQREDLGPLEEADAYQNYIRAHGVSKDQLAKELGLSRSYVYGRLKLLTLPDAVQAALRAEEIDTEVAGYIARLHTPKLQEKALAALASQHLDMEDGGKRSVRRIREFLREKYTLKLKEALFNTEDAELLPAAGACTTCPKRSGNAPEYADMLQADPVTHYNQFKGEPNLCTDPECFDAKKKAHLAVEAGKLEAKGKTVIAGNKARTLVSATGEVKAGYIALKDVKAELAKAAKVKGAAPAPQVQTVLIQDPRGGKTIEVVKEEDLKAAGVKVKAKPKNDGRYDYAAAERSRKEAESARAAQAAIETKGNVALLTAVRAAAAGVPRSAFDLQMVAAVTLGGVGWRDRQPLAALQGFKDFEKLRKAVGQMPVEKITTLLLDCALIANVQSTGNPHDDKPEALLAAAKHYGIEVKATRKAAEEVPADTKTKDLLSDAEEPADDEGPDQAGVEEAAAA